MLRSVSFRIQTVAVSLLTLGVSFQTICMASAEDQTSSAPVAAPIPVSAYVNNGLPVFENTHEMSVKDVEKYEMRMDAIDAKAEGLAPEEFARIRNMNPANNDGKVIIRVHESNDPNVAEYLEVFRQNSANPEDLTPLNLFQHGSTNQALVSTSKPTWVIKGVTRHFSTPQGNFSFDRFELMHHSAAFENAPMPHSMFFNSGIAIHAATGNEIKDLGKVASHGCVRTHPDTAAELYQYLETQPGGPKNAVVEVIAPGASSAE